MKQQKHGKSSDLIYVFVKVPETSYTYIFMCQYSVDSTHNPTSGMSLRLMPREPEQLHQKDGSVTPMPDEPHYGPTGLDLIMYQMQANNASNDQLVEMERMEGRYKEANSHVQALTRDIKTANSSRKPYAKVDPIHELLKRRIKERADAWRLFKDAEKEYKLARDKAHAIASKRG